MDENGALSRRIAFVLIKSGGSLIRNIEPRLKDPISQLTVESMLAHGPRNLSQIAVYVKQVKGSSSRTTIRAKIAVLRDEGIVSRLGETERWVLTDDFVRKLWGFFSDASHTREGLATNSKDSRRTE